MLRAAKKKKEQKRGDYDHSDRKFLKSSYNGDFGGKGKETYLARVNVRI